MKKKFKNVGMLACLAILFLFVSDAFTAWKYNPFTRKMDYYAMDIVLTGAGEVVGDVLYYDGTNWTNLPVGANTDVLTLAAGLPSWVAQGAPGAHFATHELLGGDLLDHDNLTNFVQNEHLLVGAIDHDSLLNYVAGDHIGLPNTIATVLSDWDADLDTYAGIPPSVNVQTYLGAADYAAMRTQLGLVIGTNVQALDAALTDLSTVATTAGRYLRVTGADAFEERTTANVLADIAAQASDAALTDLSTVAVNAGRYIRVAGADNFEERTVANVLADLSGNAGAAFAWNGQNLTGINSVYLVEQAEADVDIGGSGQIWVDAGNPNTLWFTDEDGTDLQLGVGADAFTLKVDVGATADYFGVAGGDGLFRFTADHFTMADGGNFVTLSLADHATARTALGLQIGANVQAYNIVLAELTNLTDPAADKFTSWDDTANNFIFSAVLTPTATGVTVGAAGNAGKLELEDTDGDVLGISVGVQAADTDYVWPLAFPGTSGFVLASTDAGTMSWVASPAHNMASHTDEGITFTGATGVNLIQFPDHLAEAFVLEEGGTSYQTFVTTNGSEEIQMNVGVQFDTIAYFIAEYDEGAEGGAFTIDWTNGQKQKVTITGVALDMSFTDPPGPCNLMLTIIQGDGDDTIDWTHDTKIGGAGGTAPTLSTGNADTDVIGIYFDGTNYWISVMLDTDLFT